LEITVKGFHTNTHFTTGFVSVTENSDTKKYYFSLMSWETLYRGKTIEEISNFQNIKDERTYISLICAELPEEIKQSTIIVSEDGEKDKLIFEFKRSIPGKMAKNLYEHLYVLKKN